MCEHTWYTFDMSENDIVTKKSGRICTSCGGSEILVGHTWKYIDVVSSRLLRLTVLLNALEESVISNGFTGLETLQTAQMVTDVLTKLDATRTAS